MKNKRKYRSIGKLNNREKNASLIISIIITIMFILGVIFMSLGFNFDSKNLPIFNYSANKNVNYQVLLKQNNFYNETMIPSKKYYAAKSVDSYIIDFEYAFNESKKTNLDYTYNVTCEIIGSLAESEENKEIWNKKFTLLKDTNAKVYKDNFLIKKQVKIDYDYYNSMARSFEENYGIAIDSILKVRFNIKYENNLSSINLKENIEDYIELNIVLSNTVTNAEENMEDNISKEILSNDKSTVALKTNYYILGSTFIVVAIIFTIIRIKKNKKTPEQIYKRNINRILKYYKELIVTVTNKPDLEGLKVMQINSIDDLIDVSEQNKSNIIHYETNKNKESKLYVIINEYVYIYTISSSELQ